MFELNDLSDSLSEAFERAKLSSLNNREEFLTPELLLIQIAFQKQFSSQADATTLLDELIPYCNEYMTCVPENIEYDGPMPSAMFLRMIKMAFLQMIQSGASKIDVPHIVYAILQLENSFARKALGKIVNENEGEFLSRLIDSYSGKIRPPEEVELPYGDTEDEPYYTGSFIDEIDNQWREYVTCLNDHINEHNPLIGREYELSRTIQILCRKDKNNPLHVGEPGVGKTAIAYGLTSKIEKGEVPERLKGSKVYELDLGALIAGTQYRGEFEKRIKYILQGIESEGNSILYIDEIHNIIGAGRVDGGSFDASNMLKRYLESGTIRFMGATTYDEYNKHFLNSKGFARRFEKIDINEPSVEECKQILRGLQSKYEVYHNVKFTDEAIDFAVVGASKYINGRFLPDKAVDLIDEAGAWIQMHTVTTEKPSSVDKSQIARVLSEICRVESLSEEKENTENLYSLESDIKEQIFGQDEAVHQVSEAVLMGTAGLIDDNKPLASLLFVGPTGVGKTEVAKVLANRLGLPLLRYDMSEYAEKHTVAKLIGSPAGYVGYDDGGLLTDAIRKTPHCVLLLDELEKAHEDIYNILLQVMDYASLTDNKGRKADFRHVVLIMTTNSGAQASRHGAMGYVNIHRAGDIMMKTVKKTFKPEFLNRLTAITVFNDMDERMASLILDKKIKSLEGLLASKSVTIDIDDDVKALLLKEGFSEEYGGREIERVINSRLKPLLMKEILFGSLKSGGKARIIIEEGEVRVKCEV